MYGEVHPRTKLANRKVQHQFLAQLVTIIPQWFCPAVNYDLGLSSNKPVNRNHSSILCLLIALKIFVL